MEESLSILNIARYSANRYRMRLTKSGEVFGGTMDRVWETTVQPSVLSVFCAQIADAVQTANRSQNGDAGLNAIASAGKGLFNALLPSRDPRIADLRRELAEMDTALLISADDPDVPWELLHDGSDFLALSKSVGRMLQSRCRKCSVPKADDTWRCLVVADPNADDPGLALPHAAAEARNLCGWLEQKGVDQLDYLEGPRASLANVLRMVTASHYDIIYYAGHTVTDPDTKEHALKLNGADFLAASSISNHVSGSPLVFLNGCWSGLAQGLKSSPDSVECLVDAFLEAGAQAVVGSMFEVEDTAARAFAESFFEAILDAHSVGDAMRGARRQVMADPRFGAAWAGFVLYGDPCLKIQTGRDATGHCLRSIGLSRHDLDDSACLVIEQAVTLGRSSGVAGTPHLFAAMVGGSDGSLRDALSRQGIPPEALRGAFEEVFSKGEPDAESAAVELSTNARDIILQARAIAEADGRSKVTEQDLVESFVAGDGGNTGDILRSLGVEVAALSPTSGARASVVPQAAGDAGGAGQVPPARMRGESPRPEPEEPELAPEVIDRVHFSVTAPSVVAPESSFILDVWAHLDSQRAEVIERAKQAAPGEDISVRSGGPARLARGTELTVVLSVDGFDIAEPEGSILWDGEIANASFAVNVPAGTAEGQRTGCADVLVNGVRIARVTFAVRVGARTEHAAVPQREQCYRKAFASYASADRDAVLARVSGIQIAAPDMDIFLDVVSLRPGQDWEQQLWTRIPESDIFYLFWSRAAAESEWVTKEWRCALDTRGIDFIAPVPLVSPSEVPPPPELTSKHFHDPWLAYLSAGKGGAPPMSHSIPTDTPADAAPAQPEQQEQEPDLPPGGEEQCDDPPESPRAEYAPDAASVLALAVQSARQRGAGVASTQDLFAGMLSDPRGQLVTRLKWLGAQVPPCTASEAGSPSAPVSADQFSQHAWQIVQAAKTIADISGRSSVSGTDLLTAFVQVGGGQMGELLRVSGIVPDYLTSELFTEGGLLDMSRFDSAAQGIVNESLSCACRKSHSMLGRRHVLYAMLRAEDGLLPRLTAEQGVDSGRLAEILYSSMPAGLSRHTELQLKVSDMSDSLVSVFCDAEFRLRDRENGLVGEGELLRALVRDGGGEAGAFLASHGVKWSSLI